MCWFLHEQGRRGGLRATPTLGVHAARARLARRFLERSSSASSSAAFLSGNRGRASVHRQIERALSIKSPLGLGDLSRGLPVQEMMSKDRPVVAEMVAEGRGRDLS